MPPPPLKQRALKDFGMELLLVRDLATMAALVGLLTLVLLYLDATRARP